MNTPDPTRHSLPDHANEPDDRALDIDQVGIIGLSYPISVWDRARKLQHTVAKIGLTVGLPQRFKGTHMSRFVEILNEHRGELSLGTVPLILAEVQRRLNADDAFIDVAFPYFMERHAPVSGATSLMEYLCAFHAALRGPALEFTLKVTVPVKTLCPCSKAVSKYGAHNQRGLITVEARFDGMLWIEDIVEAVESCASSPLYALLKREDEKYVTEKAYENPRFVEDLVRNVVIALRDREGVRWLRVSAENIESIHNHSAFAQITWPSASPPPPSPIARRMELPLGEWIRLQRAERGVTQRELAEAIGLSASALCRVERGERTLPAEAAPRLARAWGLDEARVLLRAGVVPPALLRRVAEDPEGFFAWAQVGGEPTLQE